MPAGTIRNLSAETHRALKAHAADHGRSTGAEICDILGQGVRPADWIKLGALVDSIGREAGLTAHNGAYIANLRDRTPSDGVRFE